MGVSNKSFESAWRALSDQKVSLVMKNLLVVENFSLNHSLSHFRRGLKVHCWVARNEPSELLWDYGLDPYRQYEDLISNVGVDGIFTDFPWSLRNYLDFAESCE